MAVASSAERGSGEIVFANGGRVVSIKADGSGRKVLTRKKGRVVAERAWDAVIPVEDSRPSISPDGTKLLFQRDFDTGPVSWRTELIVANREGTGQKVIAKWKNPVITWLGWSPDNRVVVNLWDYQLDRKGERQKFRVISLDRESGDRRLLLSREYKASQFSNHDRFFSARLQVSDFSPDGKLLYAVGDLRRTSLREHDLGSGADRLIIAGAEQGTYSPDGSKIAFTSEGEGLWTANLDGTERRRLIAGTGGVSEPDWAPDGNRILFTSARNFPGGGDEAFEIYSVATDGSCLTWLTNGSPESTDAAWAPEALRSSPESCGDDGRKPLVEVTPVPSKVTTSPRLWAGPSVNGRLLSSATVYSGSDSYYYADCAYFDRSRCREGLVLDSIPICNPGNLASGVQIYPSRLVPSIRRGALLATSRGKNGRTSALLATGRVELYFGDSDFLETGGIPTTTKDLKSVVDQLRPVGPSVHPGSKLPRPAVKPEDIRRFNRVYRLYARTGSISRTAKRVGTSKADVRWLIRHRSLMNKLKPFKAARCGR